MKKFFYGNKIVLYFGLFCAFLFSFSFAFADTVEFGNTNPATWVQIGSGSYGYALPYEFVMIFPVAGDFTEYNLNSIQFPLTKHPVGSCGSASISVYSDTNQGVSRGTLLGTSQSVDCSSVPAYALSNESHTWEELSQTYTFNPPLLLNEGVPYTFVVSVDTGTYTRPAQPVSGGESMQTYSDSSQVTYSSYGSGSWVVDYSPIVPLPSVPFANQQTSIYLLSTTTCEGTSTSSTCQYFYATTTAQNHDYDNLEVMALFGLMFYALMKSYKLIRGR